jgi:hypothetical protein
MYGQEQMKTMAASGSCQSSQLLAPPERDTPEVTRAINDLRCVVDRYDHLVGRMHDRLDCVTTPAPPMCSNEAKESGYCTGLASAINEVRCKLRDITNSLESLYERIEL